MEPNNTSMNVGEVQPSKNLEMKQPKKPSNDIEKASTAQDDSITWSMVSYPAVVSDDEDKKAAQEPKGWCTKKKIKCYIILGVILLIVIILLILWNIVSKRFFTWLLETVSALATSNSFGSFAFFIGAQCCFSWFVLPGLSYFNIIMSFFMKNFIKAWMIATLGAWGAAVFLFVLIRFCFKQKLEKRFKDNSLFKVIKSEIKENPWKTSTFVNILFIPTAFKNYTLPLTELTLIQYMVPSLPFYAFFSGMLCLIGAQISSIEQLSSDRGFSELTIGEKINFIMGWVLLAATLVIVVLFGRIAKKKMAQIKKDERADRANKKKHKIRLEKYEKAMQTKGYEQTTISQKIELVKPYKEDEYKK